MLMQTNFTRRAAFKQELLENVSPEFEESGIECDVAISAAALDKVLEVARVETGERYYLREIAWSFRLHETGKIQPLDRDEGERGVSLTFRTFLNRDGDPAEIVLKGARDRGDYGEPVLTIMLPGEQFEFTGKLISLRAEFLAVLSQFVNPDQYMSPMNCVRVEPAPGGGVFMVALSGHCMGVFHDPDAYCEEPMNLRLTKDLVRNCKTKCGEYGQRRVILDNGDASVEDSQGRVHYIEPSEVLVEGDFHDWRPLLDKAMDKAEATNGAVPSPLYEPRSLGLFEFQGPRNGLRLYPTGSGSPVVVRSDAYPSFVGLVMPLTVESEETPAPRPDWMAAGFGPLDNLPAIIEQSMAVQ